MRAIFAALVLFLPGCAERPPPKPEPCEVWVNDYHRRKSDCVSHEHIMRDVGGKLVEC